VGEDDAPSPDPSPPWRFLKKFFIPPPPPRPKPKVAVAAAAGIAYWCWWWVGGSDMATDAGSGWAEG
jgi:hypothetical protein